MLKMLYEIKRYKSLLLKMNSECFLTSHFRVRHRVQIIKEITESKQKLKYEKKSLFYLMHHEVTISHGYTPLKVFQNFLNQLNFIFTYKKIECQYSE